MSKRYWTPGQLLCSVWPKKYFKPLLSYVKTLHVTVFPGWGTPESLQHTAHIAAPLCSGGLAFSLAWHQEKTKWHLSRDHLNFISSFVQTKLQPPLCFCIRFAGQVQPFCNLDVWAEILRMTGQELKNVSWEPQIIPTLQFYSTAAWMSTVPDTTKSHSGCGDNPWLQPSTTG